MKASYSPMPMPVPAAIFSIAFHSLSVTQKDFFLFRLRPLVAMTNHLCFFCKSGFGLPPEKIMRLAHAAFGGGSPNALLALVPLVPLVLAERDTEPTGKSFRLHFPNG